MNEAETNAEQPPRHAASLEYWLRPGDALETEGRNGRCIAVRLVRGGRALDLGIAGIAPALTVCAAAIQLFCQPFSALASILLRLLALPLKYAYVLGLSAHIQRLADFSRRLETLLRLPVEIVIGLLSQKTSAPSENKIYSGALRENMCWDGDISIIGDIVIPRGTTLTVKAGTNISFLHRQTRPVRFLRAVMGRVVDFSKTQNCRIYVDGSIRVEGTAEQPVVLSGAGAMVFSGSGNGCLRHAVFEDCGNAVFLCDAARLKAEHCRMTTRGGNGVTISGGARAALRGLNCSGAEYACVATELARLRLRDSTITNAGAALLAQDASQAALRKMRISETANGGLEINGGKVFASNSVFDSTGHFALHLKGRASAILRGCEFMRSKSAALLAEDGGTMILDNCRLQDNSSGVELRNASADISGTTFKNSSTAHILLSQALAVLSEVHMESSPLAIACAKNSKTAVNNLYIRACAQNAVRLGQRSAISGYLLKCADCGSAAISLDNGSSADMADSELASAPIGLELKGASRAVLRRSRILNCLQSGATATGASSVELLGCEIKACGTALNCADGSHAVTRMLACKDNSGSAILLDGGARLDGWQVRLHNSGGTAIVARGASTLHIRDLEAHSQPGALLADGGSTASIRGGLLRDTANCGFSARGGSRLSLLSVGVFGGAQAVEAGNDSCLEAENCLLSGCENGLRASGSKTTMRGLSAENCSKTGLVLSGGLHKADAIKISNCAAGLAVSESASLSLESLALKDCSAGAILTGAATLAVKIFESNRCKNPLQVSTSSMLDAEKITALGPGRIGISITGNSSVRAKATTVSGFADGLACDNSVFESLSADFKDNPGGLKLTDCSSINCESGRISGSASAGLSLGVKCRGRLKNIEFSENSQYGLYAQDASAGLQNCRFEANGTAIFHAGGALELSACAFTASTRGGILLSGGSHHLNGADMSGGEIGLGLYDGARAQGSDLAFQSCQTGVDLRGESELVFEKAAMRRCATGVFAAPRTTLTGNTMTALDSASSALQLSEGAKVRLQSMDSLNCGGTAVLCSGNCVLHIGAINLNGAKTGLRTETGSRVECLSGRISGASADGVFLLENCSLKLAGVELSGNAGHGLYSRDSDAVFTNCRINSNDTGILLHGGALTLSACAVADNSDTGIKLSGGTHQLGDASLSGGIKGLELIEKAVAKAGTLSLQNSRTGIRLSGDSELKAQDIAFNGCPTGLLAELKSSTEAESLRAEGSEASALSASDWARLTLKRFEAKDCGVGALLSNNSELRLSAAHLSGCKTGLRLERSSKAVCEGGDISGCSEYSVFLCGASSLRLSGLALKPSGAFSIWAQESSSVSLENCALSGGNQAVTLRESSSETNSCRFEQDAAQRGSGTALEADALSRVESCRDSFSGYARGLDLSGSARAYAICTKFSDMAEAALRLKDQASAKTESCRYVHNKTSVSLTDSAQHISRADEFALSETGLRLEGESHAALAGALLKEHSATALLLWGNKTSAESRNCRYERNKISLLAGGDATYSSSKDTFALSTTGLRLESGAKAALSGTTIREHHDTGMELLGAKTTSATANCRYEGNKISMSVEGGASYSSNRDSFRLSETGLRIRGGSQAALSGTAFEEHSATALLAWDAATDIQTEHCRFARNGTSVRAGSGAGYRSAKDEFRASATGLHIEDGARATLSSSAILEHTGTGLQLQGKGTSVKTENCRWKKNKLSLSAETGADYSALKDEFHSSATGLQITGGARAVMTDARLEGHAEAGLLVWSEGSTAETTACRHIRNRCSVRVWDGARYSSRNDEFAFSENGLSLEGRASASLSGTEVKDHAGAGLRLSGGKTAVASENCRYSRNKLSALAEDDAVFTSNHDEFSLSETGLRLHIGAKTLLAEGRFKNHSAIALQLFSAMANACGCVFAENKIAVLADSASRLRLYGGACSGNQTAIAADGKSRVSARETLFSDSRHCAVECGAGTRFAALNCVFSGNQCGIRETPSCRVRLRASPFEDPQKP